MAAPARPGVQAYWRGRRAIVACRADRHETGGRKTAGRALAAGCRPRLRASSPSLARPTGPFSVSAQGLRPVRGRKRRSALSDGETKVGVSRPISRVLSGGHLRDGHSSGAPLARRLEQPTRAAAGIEPGTLGRTPNVPCRPYSVLLPVGFTVPPPLPEARCALTAPFHPCHCGLPRTGGLISVALSLGSPPAAVSRHRQSLEPGLSSTAR
jgi:hypothetical protein